MPELRLPARPERAELDAERNRCYAHLGRAVFEGDETGREATTTALATIVERSERKEAEIHSLIQDIDERVRRAQAGVAPTKQLEAEAPPEPARVPEPSPGGPPPEPEPAPVPQEDARRTSSQ